MGYTAREIIVSKSNPLFVKLSKLLQKKYREAEGLFMFDGEKLFSEACDSGLDLVMVIVDADYINRAEKAAFVTERLKKYTQNEVVLVTLGNSLIGKFTEEKAPQGIITVAKTIDFSEKYNKIYNNEIFFDGSRKTLMLSNIRDPGNLGTIIRSAAAFEADAVYVSKGCADLFGAKVVRGSMGALFRQPIRPIEDEVAFIEELKMLGVGVYAAALERNAKRLGEQSTDDKKNGECYVIGNEGEGLSREIIESCSETVFIPMSEKAESLNASVAASVILWEMYRGR